MEYSKFFMKPSKKALNGYTYFSIGWKTWEKGYFYDIQKNKAYAEKNEKSENISGYYIDDVHLIIDKYYGEFYNEKSKTIEEIAREAKKICFWMCFCKFWKIYEIVLLNYIKN